MALLNWNAASARLVASVNRFNAFACMFIQCCGLVSGYLLQSAALRQAYKTTRAPGPMGPCTRAAWGHPRHPRHPSCSCIASIWRLNGPAPAEAAAGAGCRCLLRRSRPRRRRPPRPRPARSSVSPLWTSSSLWPSQQQAPAAATIHALVGVGVARAQNSAAGKYIE